MKGFKTFGFFACITLLGLIAMIQPGEIEAVLLPALCHIDPTAMPTTPDACVERVVKLSGGVMVAVGVAGKFLRFVTTSGIFKAE